MQVEWKPCSEGLPPVSDEYVWIADYEQLWGLATLTDGKPYHSEDFWSLLGGDSVSQMFVTHWAKRDYPDLPQRPGVPLPDREGREVKQCPRT